MQIWLALAQCGEKTQHDISNSALTSCHKRYSHTSTVPICTWERRGWSWHTESFIGTDQTKMEERDSSQRPSNTNLCLRGRSQHFLELFGVWNYDFFQADEKKKSVAGCHKGKKTLCGISSLFFLPSHTRQHHERRKTRQASTTSPHRWQG